ncbi:MAG: dienelactone hydrolase family protein [Deltaproteobacteria bacterium]|nr:dienelactone hydrolase family protein [Deltaproteobacteria bacterium]
MALTFAAAVLFVPAFASAKVVTESVTYEHDGTKLEGYFAYDPELRGKRPGIMIVHDWLGLDDYPKMRARQIAELGYVAFAVDIYGAGVRPKNSEEAGKEAGKYRADRALMRARAGAGLARLKRHPKVDPAWTAAIGYCFGGGVVLELARSGADVTGVVSFHGNLDTPNPDDAKKMHAKVLVLHGADDPYVPAEQVKAFEDEMRAAGVDWQLVKYGDAVHAFTRVGAGTDKSKGAAYNERADRRSWQAMRDFFGEIFK